MASFVTVVDRQKKEKENTGFSIRQGWILIAATPNNSGVTPEK